MYIMHYECILNVKGGVAKTVISQNMEHRKMDIIKSKKSYIVIAK